MIAAERCMLNIDDSYSDEKGLGHIATCTFPDVFQFTKDPLQNIEDILD
jgi:hypothetical protein